MINITNLSEITLDDALETRSFDLFLGFLCNESRSVHVLKRSYKKCQHLSMFIAEKLNIESKLPHPRWANKVEKMEVFFENEELDSNSLENLIKNKLNSLENNKNPIRLLLDISSMPRPIMASLMAVIDDFTTTRQIEMVVSYCLAKYTPPPEHNMANKFVRPVHPNFTGFTVDPGQPVAAVVGLGYEKGKALGAVEYLQSSNWWIFVPTSEERKYLKKVQQHNQTIFNVVEDDRTFEYSIHSPLLTLSKLESLISKLLVNNKTVLLPFGPKIFFFCSLLVSLVHKNCAVWYVSGETQAGKADISTSAYVMCLSFKLEMRDLNDV